LEYLEQVPRLAQHWPKTTLLALSPQGWRQTFAGLTAEQRASITPLWELDCVLQRRGLSRPVGA
jgi:hypothetical protein